MCLHLSGIPIGRMSLACSDICPNLTAAIPWEDGHEKITDSLGDYGGHLLVCIVFAGTLVINTDTSDPAPKKAFEMIIKKLR